MTASGSDDYATFRRALRRASPQLTRPLPWIAHPDPWAVMVSEFMLQQTQTSRVIEPWARFLVAFPTPAACADAPLSQVLRLWSGLGYSRRAKALHDAARHIRDDFAGTVPDSPDELRRLRGVGEYTANAVATFAYGRRVAVLDTNVGRVLARALANRVLRPAEARELAQRLLPRREPAAFNQAMLDLGAQFCRSSPRCGECPLAPVCRWRIEGGDDPAPRSAGVSRRQSAFTGSDRQIRGRVLLALQSGPMSRRRLDNMVEGIEQHRLDVVLDGLIVDGLIERHGATLHLVGD